MYIHQIFIDIGQGRDFRDNPIFLKCYIENTKFILNTNFKIKIWNEKEIDLLITQHYPKYIDIINNFPNKFYKIDFVRPLILHYNGGIYLDMDNILIELPDINRKYILANWKNEIANDLIYFNDKRIYIEYVEFMLNRIEICKMPNNWTVRRFQYCVGQKCFNQFCKKYKYLQTQNIYTSYYTSTWLKAFGKIKYY